MGISKDVLLPSFSPHSQQKSLTFHPSRRLGTYICPPSCIIIQMTHNENKKCLWPKFNMASFHHEPQTKHFLVIVVGLKPLWRLKKNNILQDNRVWIVELRLRPSCTLDVFVKLCGVFRPTAVRATRTVFINWTSDRRCISSEGDCYYAGVLMWSFSVYTLM